MKKLYVCFFIFLSTGAFTREQVDSLLEALETSGDTARIEILRELCWETRYSNPPDALKYGLEALLILKEIKLPQKEAEISNFAGIIQRNVGDHATALEYFNEAQRIALEYGLRTELAYAYNNIGDIYNRLGKYTSAIDYELKALDLFVLIGDSSGISYVCHQLSLTHANLGNYEVALGYDERSLRIRERMGNTAGVAYSLISIGQNHMKMGNYTEAILNLKKSEEIFRSIEDRYGLCFSKFNTGMYYHATGDIEMAIEYLDRTIELGLETDSRILVRNSAEALSELYAQKGKFEDAYRMHQLFKTTYDSLYHDENLVKITQIVMQQEYDQKDLLHEAELAKQKQLRNYLMLSIALVIILVLVLFNRYRLKRKANIMLSERNKEIDNQRKTLENLFVSLRIKNDELQQQKDEILAQKDHLVLLNSELEKQKSELNRTLNDLTQAETHLVQSEKMASLGQLTAGVAHELNNPINFINASINPLQRNTEDLLSVLENYEAVIEEKKLSGEFNQVEELKDSLDIQFLIRETRNLLKGINEGATRSEQIVRNLRTFSRMDENEFKAVDIHEGLESTLLLLRNQMQNRVEVEKDYGKIPFVECLPGKLNQVFMNILTNSILAIRGKGIISVRTEHKGEYAEICIKDTGIGMTEEVREHIFDPFFTTREVGSGTGLGLSITYSIIEEHKGSIQVVSEPGEGAEFIIRLPIVQPA